MDDKVTDGSEFAELERAFYDAVERGVVHYGLSYGHAEQTVKKAILRLLDQIARERRSKFKVISGGQADL